MRTVLCAVAFISEFAHFVSHLLVLSGYYSIIGVVHRLRVCYFAWDMTSNLLCFYLTRRGVAFVVVHFCIHMLAVSNLLGWSSAFFEFVFRMAEQQFDAPPEIAKLYVTGTLIDVVTHMVHMSNLVKLHQHKQQGSSGMSWGSCLSRASYSSIFRAPAGT